MSFSEHSTDHGWFYPFLLCLCVRKKWNQRKTFAWLKFCWYHEAKPFGYLKLQSAKLKCFKNISFVNCDTSAITTALPIKEDVQCRQVHVLGRWWRSGSGATCSNIWGGSCITLCQDSVMISDSVPNYASVRSWLSWTESCSLSGGDVQKNKLHFYILGEITHLGMYTCIICYILLLQKFITSCLLVYGTSGISVL